MISDFWRRLFLREDDAIVATQVHIGKESQQSVIIRIKITILERLVLGLPEGVNKLLALIV